VKRGVRNTLWVLGALFMLLGLALGWLLYTESGRDFVLQRMLGEAAAAPSLQMASPQACQRQPLPAADDPSQQRRFQYRSADGMLGRGPIVFHGVSYRLDDGTALLVERLRVDARRLGLFARALNVTAFEADGVEVWIPEEPEDAVADMPGFELPETLPWPEFELPFDVDVERATVRDLRIFRGERQIFGVERLITDLRWPRGEPLLIESLEGAGAEGRLTAQGIIRLDGVAHAELDIRFQPTPAAAPVGLDIRPLDGGLRATVDVPDSGVVVLEIDRDLNWQLDAQLQGFEPGRWWPDAADEPPIDIALQAQGDRERATLEGMIGRDGRTVQIHPSTLMMDTPTLQLRLDPLRLTLDDGSDIMAVGDVGLGDPLQLDLALEAAPLLLPIGDGEPARYRGRAWLSGTLDALAIRLDGSLVREDLQASIQLQGLLGEDSLHIERLALTDGTGRVAASGSVGWQPRPHWELDIELQQFDPGVLAEELTGQLQGRVRSSGILLDDGLSIDLVLDDLRGRMRGQPLRGEGELSLRPDGSGHADLGIRLGDSAVRVRGDPGNGRDLAIEIESLQLADLLPDAGGVLSGRLRVRGVGDAARVEGRLGGSNLRYQDQRAAQVEIELATPLDLSGGGRLQVSAQDAELGGEPIFRLEVDASGGIDAMQAGIEVEGPRLALSSALVATRQAQDWAGQVRSLQLRSGVLPDFTLEQPADFRIGDAGVAIGPGCVRAEQGRACFDVARLDDGQRVALELEDFPLSLLDPWLSRADADTPLRLEGSVAGSANLQIIAGTLQQGELDLRSDDGALHWLDDPPVQLIAWSGLHVQGRLQDGRLQVEFVSTLDEGGSVQARVSGGSPFADAPQPIDGRIDLNLPQVRLLKLLPEAVVAPSGSLQASIHVAGSWDNPLIRGDVELARFTAEIPALGITLTDSSLQLGGDLDRLQIEGVAHSAGQPLRFNGAIEDVREQPVVSLEITGTDVLLFDTPQVRAVASPAITAQYSGERLRLRGTLTVPSARLRLDLFERAESISADVVVLDPRPEREIQEPLPIDADIQVVLGEDVELLGFGFDGGLAGSLRVRELPGRPTTARGTLSVRGEYTAYGQDLSIDRGRLTYAGTPIDDPALDLRVVRQVRGTEVGLYIRGSARDPTVTVWSSDDASIDQGEALSLLLFGRPLGATGAADNDQLTQAALAVGGNLLAARVGARLGFDTFEVADSETLGGTAFTVGRYLSPRLHIGYGVALFGQGQVFTLRYMITERLEAELQAGEQNRAALNYRVER
jgi:translocation and assembly module TamB